MSTQVPTVRLPLQLGSMLFECEARLNLALENAGMGMWELDLSTGDCRCSDRMVALLGLPPDGHPGTFIRALESVVEEDRQVVSLAKNAAAAGSALDIEFRTKWRDGTVHWINVKGGLAPSSETKSRRLVGVAQEITDRKEAEASLRRSEHLLRTILDSTTAVVYVIDAHDRIVLVNRQFEKLFPLDGNGVAGRSLYECFPEEFADQFAANNRKVLQAGASCEFEEIAPHTDGPHTYVAVKAPLYDAGVPYAISGVSTDITERKRLVAALEKMQRQKDAVIATIAHELRQPLGAIQAAVAVMRARISREKGERARTILERQVAQLSRLIEDLLDASRIVQGTIALRRARTSVADVINAAVAVVQPLVRDREQHLSVSVPDDPLWLDADAQRLQQVFSNLLTNASKFTDPQGRISVTAERDADSLIVRVRDTGRGIAPDALQHIFELFTQASPDERGLGIGLAVVRGLVERHGGSVDAHSAGPGQGSEFVVRLPIAPG